MAKNDMDNKAASKRQKAFSKGARRGGMDNKVDKTINKLLSTMGIKRGEKN